MKRQRFRFGEVLRYYELRKERSEYAVQQASRVLREIDVEIERLEAEIVATAALLDGQGQSLTTAGWLACYRNAEHVNTQLAKMRARRVEQANVVARLAEERKRWAVAVETLESLKARTLEFNRGEAARTQQLQLDEVVLRQWLDADA